MEKQMERFFEMALRRLANAESQTYDELELAAEKACSATLKEAFSRHRRETALQIERLEDVFEMLGIDPTKTKIGEAEGVLEKGKEMVKSLATMEFVGKSKSMEGVIDEANEMMKYFADTSTLDFVLIAGAKAIEAEEIAAYEVLCLIAEENGLRGVAELLETSLEEERRMHELLVQMSEEEIRKAV